jgi:hypothetical protein
MNLELLLQWPKLLLQEARGIFGAERKNDGDSVRPLNLQAHGISSRSLSGLANRTNDCRLLSP